jgi:hypothetical protein
MAYRTDATAVGGIIEVDDSISVTPFIEAANHLVTSCCTDSDTDYTAAQLELIERWLAAHLYAVRDPRAVSETVGPIGAKYESKVDLGLHLTRYGQQAMLLDTAGGLAALNGRVLAGKAAVTPGVTWAGTDDWDVDNITGT